MMRQPAPELRAQTQIQELERRLAQAVNKKGSAILQIQAANREVRALQSELGSLRSGIAQTLAQTQRQKIMRR